MNFFLPSLLCVVFFVLFGFLVSRVAKRNDVADILWGLGFVLIAVVNAITMDSLSFLGRLVLFFVLLWGVRLSLHIGIRAAKKPEDQRYANWRKEWGNSEPIRAFLQVFLLQGLILGVISLPVIWAIRLPCSGIGPFEFLGAAVYLAGFLIEAMSDLQLTQFKAEPGSKGKIITTGLWAYSRHPNYFGEILVWWGIFLMVMNTPSGYFTIASPLLISFLLLKVSGVPMLERLLEERGKEFKEYVQRTPAIFPIQLISVFQLLATMIVMALLDGLWLGIIMKDFYRVGLGGLVRDNWNPVIWAAVGVYVFMAFGIHFFATRQSPRWSDSVFKGCLLGLVIYAVYDLTNLSLIKNWPAELALVDILWGGFLCSMAALATHLLMGVGKVKKSVHSGLS